MADYKAPGRCPVCGGVMHVAKVTCDTCGSELTGRFSPCRFCSLDEQNLRFLEIFVKNRGNIKDIEREMGISYPTVRSALDNLLTALGYGAEQPKPTKREILDRLARGELSREEALSMLEELAEREG